MNAIVIYKSKYGSTKAYGKWIAEELSCKAVEANGVGMEEMKGYDTIIYGGGLYAENIAGVTLLTKNFDQLKGKRLIVYTTGITPLACREYYEEMVWEKNFKGIEKGDIKVFNFLGKMVMSELSLPHRTALKTLKKIMSSKENPTEMEKLLVELCDADGDFTDRLAIGELIQYAKGE